jgi:protein phosphatase
MRPVNVLGSEVLTHALRWGVATDAGRRGDNEDRLFAEPPVFAVADGVGGRAAGEVASELAVAELRRLAGAAIGPDAVLAAVRRANAAIRNGSIADRALTGMRTTLVGLVLVHADGEPHWMVVNVGDSRLYRLHRGRLERVTVDHSLVQTLVDRGEITEAEARFHPRRNVVTRVLGSHPDPQVDFWLRTPVPGERFLLCTDGLSEELGDEEIHRTLAGGQAPASTAVELARLAVLRGGRDNITVIVVDVMSPDDADR